MMQLARDLGDRLRERSLSIAVAESCTAGGLAYEITRVPGASEYFLGGVIAYDDAVKADLLGVPASTIDRFGAVSAETAAAMADACRRLLAADVAVSITGIAGPGGGSREKPVGTVFVAIACEGRSGGRRLSLDGLRDAVRERTVEAALEFTLSFLDEPAL